MLAVTLTALAAACAAVASRDPSPAAQRTSPGAVGDKQPDSSEAAVRRSTAALVKALNSGDAKTVAANWTKDGEYLGPDGEVIRGRAAIAKGYAELFTKHPKIRVDLQADSVRLMGRQAALEQGTARVRLNADEKPQRSRYSILHVRDDDGWKMASVREWVPDPAELVTVKDLDWLVGDWQARTGDTEVHTHYSWDEDKAFLRCRYTLTQDGKVVAAGTQVIGKNPAGGLRSWLFDRSGSYGESVWTPDDDRWLIEASATLPDGSEVTGTNVLIPLGRDAFTWQVLERTVAGSPVAGTPPVRVTRVKQGK
jgi:uncharacterized protein (TIGR02246 family)